MRRTLCVIDLMPFLYRGHFVFLNKPRITSSGLNTSALLGFVNGVMAVLKELAPTHAVLAMDPAGKTFRHEAYPEYKARRQKMPEDLASVPGFDPLPPETAIGPGADPFLARARESDRR